MKKLLLGIFLLSQFLVAGTYEAVCVGIDEYQNSWQNNANCSVNNARDMQDRLINQGFNSVEILENSYATKSNIESAITAMDRDAGNICIYYHSGHGDVPSSTLLESVLYTYSELQK